MITYLAIAFIIFLLGSVLYGFSIVMKRPPTKEELKTETCSLCRKRYEKENLVEREVGDYRVYYFCANCIAKLYDELVKTAKPQIVSTKKLLSDLEDKKRLN